MTAMAFPIHTLLARYFRLPIIIGIDYPFAQSADDGEEKSTRLFDAMPRVLFESLVIGIGLPFDIGYSFGSALAYPYTC